MTNKDRVYFDSCCFIDMVKVDLGKDDLSISEDRKKDVWFLRRLSDAAFNNDIEIITSTLTIAECLHVGDGQMNDEGKEQISADPFVCEMARDLHWKNNILLRGADLIHIASAMFTDCKEFITTDDRITKQQKFIDALPEIRNLGLKVIRASESKILPNSYRQGDFKDEI